MSAEENNNNKNITSEDNNNNNNNNNDNNENVDSESKPITFDFSKAKNMGATGGTAGSNPAAGATDTPFNTPVFSAFGQNQLQDMLNKAGFSREDSASMFIDTLSPQVRRRVTAVRGVHSDLADLRSDFEKELKELIKKYEKLYAPLYEKRSKIVSGEVEPSDEEVETAEEKIKEEDEKDKTEEKEEKEEEKEEEKDVKGIPEFWLRALRQHPAISPNIQDKDDDALKYLVDIRSSHLEDSNGFKLEFEFTENPYFTNQVLTKTYYIEEEEWEDSLQKAEGTKIDWKPQKNLTEKKVKKTQTHKKGGKKRTVIKSEPVDSFFNFFNPPDLDQEDSDDEYNQDLEELMEVDLDLGRIIKDAVIPKAVDYYLGKVDSYPGMDFDGEEFGYDDEDEDDEDGQVPIRAEGGQECKQQ